MSSPGRQATISAVVSVALFAMGVVANKSLVRDLSLCSIVFLRCTIGSLSLISIALALSAPRLVRIAGRDLPFFATTSIVTMLQWFAASASVSYISASRYAVLYATSPLWSAGLDALTRRDRVSGRQLLGICITIVGVIITTGENDMSAAFSRTMILGIAFGFTAAIANALAGKLQKTSLLRHGPYAVATYRMLLAAMFLLPWFVYETFFHHGFGALGSDASVSSISVRMASLAVAGTGIPMLLWSFSLSKLPVTRVLVFSSMMPIVVIGMSRLLIDEAVTMTFLLGALVIVTGVAMCQVPNRPRYQVLADPRSTAR